MEKLTRVSMWIVYHQENLSGRIDWETGGGGDPLLSPCQENCIDALFMETSGAKLDLRRYLAFGRTELNLSGHLKWPSVAIRFYLYQKEVQ